MVFMNQSTVCPQSRRWNWGPSQYKNAFLSIHGLPSYLYNGNPYTRKGILLSQRSPGPWFNIKTTSYQYRKSHCGDKTILRPSYLHNGISYTGKMTSLYWIGALVLTTAAMRTRRHPIRYWRWKWRHIFEMHNDIHNIMMTIMISGR